MNDEAWHKRSPETVARQFEVDPATGLDDQTVMRRRSRYGANRLTRRRQRHPLRILLRQFRSIVILVLAVAGLLALLLGHHVEAAAVMAVVVINTLIGFFSEWRAARSMAALQGLQADQVRVRRDGRSAEIAATELVPGDVLLLAEGDLVPADARVVEAEGLQCDQAALTGESVAVIKTADPVAADTPLAERHGMLYKGTTLTRGAGVAIVTATGMDTELGTIADLTASARSSATPLQARLDQLGHRLAWVVLGLAAGLAALGLLAGRDMVVMVETAIALGVAAVPEGLPIVATLALARGMWLMARRNALINHLAAVETLGSTGIILTDKTGTLTANRMHLETLALPPDVADETAARQRALTVGVLCSNAELAADSDDGADHGDPMEIALLEAGREAGLHRRQLIDDWPEVYEQPFDAERMMMATCHETSDDGLRVAVKGAPEAVLAVSDLDEAGRDQWRARVEELAGGGLRPLLLAERTIDAVPDDPDQLYEALQPVGLAGLMDPPRPGVADAVAACQRAGVQVIMVTGDQAATARAIAAAVGIGRAEDLHVLEGQDLGDRDEGGSGADATATTDSQVFARVTPAQKLDLVTAFQDAGYVVAMTGDGVNDAPALKKADIGIAMGQRGTDAAREVGDIILQDDRFERIVTAIRHGRGIFANIRRSLMFMLCTNFAEVASVALATLAGAPLPLLPLQILYLNLLTDVFPALALAVGAAPANIMKQPPRPAGEAILTRRHWLAIGAWSAVIAATILGVLYLALTALGLDQASAVTISFLTLGFSKLWFVFALREPATAPWRGTVAGNPWIWVSLAVCGVLLAAAVYLPGLDRILGTAPIGGAGWLLVIAASLVPLMIGELRRLALALRA